MSHGGYVNTSVEDIIVSAGVSRRTFYDNFRDKEDAFLAAYDGIVGSLTSHMHDAFAAADSFASRVRDSLAAFLAFLAREPRLAKFCIVEVFAAGPKAVERRRAVMRAFAQLIRTAAEDYGDSSRRPPDLTADAIVGGVYEVVYSRVVAGESANVYELQQDLAYSIMVPYLGRVAAAREAATPPSVPMTIGDPG